MVKKNKQEKILRNWKVVWTILSIILTLFVVYLGFKVNFPSKDIGWNMIKLNCIENRIGNNTKCMIAVDSASSIFFHLHAGLFGFLIIQIINIPIWIGRAFLVE